MVVVAIAADLRSLWLAVPKEGNHFGCGSLPAANHSLASGARRPACRPLGLLIDHPPCPLERPCFWRLAPVARRACLCPLAVAAVIFLVVGGLEHAHCSGRPEQRTWTWTAGAPCRCPIAHPARSTTTTPRRAFRFRIAALSSSPVRKRGKRS